jgi:hypothetical protein
MYSSPKDKPVYSRSSVVGILDRKLHPRDSFYEDRLSMEWFSRPNRSKWRVKILLGCRTGILVSVGTGGALDFKSIRSDKTGAAGKESYHLWLLCYLRS